jgi:hypothetical protein
LKVFFNINIVKYIYIYIEREREREIFIIFFRSGALPIRVSALDGNYD